MVVWKDPKQSGFSSQVAARVGIMRHHLVLSCRVLQKVAQPVLEARVGCAWLRFTRRFEGLGSVGIAAGLGDQGVL